jgi:hypothetical protein
MSIENDQIPAGSSNPDDEVGFGLQSMYTSRFVKSSFCLDGLMSKSASFSSYFFEIL